MKRLVTSTPTTLRWLSKIKSEIDKKEFPLEYGESKYWAYFKSLKTNRNIVYLHPQKSQIRLFTRLPLSSDTRLQQTPASSGWAKMYPSIFLIKSETAIEKAVELVFRSYEHDLSQ